MAVVQGANVLVSTGVTPTAIALLRNTTLTMGSETVDVTTRDDSNWRKIIPSTRDASVDFESVFDAANATHEQIWTDFDAQTEIDLNVDVDTDEWTGKGYYTNITMEGGFAGEITVSGSITVNGALAKTP